jgi:hypothetical protein
VPARALDACATRRSRRHAQEDVGAYAIVLTVKDRPDMEVDGLVAAERRSMTESFMYDSTVSEVPST